MLLLSSAAPRRTEVEREVDETERLHDAEGGVVGLLERTPDEVDRALELGGVADLELRRLARRVARGIEQRDHLAGRGVDRCGAGVGVGQVLVLVTLAGNGVHGAETDVPLEIHVEAVDVDDLALAHLEQRIVAQGRTDVVEGIAGRTREAERIHR